MLLLLLIDDISYTSKKLIWSVNFHFITNLINLMFKLYKRNQVANFTFQQDANQSFDQTFIDAN